MDDCIKTMESNQYATSRNSHPWHTLQGMGDPTQLRLMTKGLDFMCMGIVVDTNWKGSCRGSKR